MKPIGSSIKLCIIICFSLFQTHKKVIPVWFEEYGIEIRDVPNFRDTIRYNKSENEDFKLVFYSSRGKCYCERYVNGKLYEKGYFANSFDTLKQYVSKRSPGGKSTPIQVQEYFQPLKNGEWIVYKDKMVKETYKLGVLISSEN